MRESERRETGVEEERMRGRKEREKR